MSRFLGKKNRIARKFGVNIFTRKKNPVARRPYGPGQHGNKKGKKRSEFGQQLHEKQKLAYSYGGIPLNTLSRYYKEALGKPGNAVDHFIHILESRLDVLVYRLKFSPTIFGAQQLVSHGHILVDGKKVDIRSFRVKPGQKISIKEKSRSLPLVQEGLNSSRDLPSYSTFDPLSFEGQLLCFPSSDQVPFVLPIDVAQVCGYLAYTT